MFKTGTTKPAKPVGGSFNGTAETIPTGYQDAPYFEANKTTYVSKAVYIHNGTNWVNQGWSDPAPYSVQGADGLTPSIITNGDGSYTISNGAETITIKDGDNGDNAPIPTVVDNGNGTHTVTDGAGNSIVVRDGTDGYTPIKGTDYFDGLNGNFNSLVYKTATSLPDTPVGGTFDGVNESFPSGWSDAPYFYEGQITYVSKGVYKDTGTGWVRNYWSEPEVYTLQGQQGKEGKAAFTNLIRSEGVWQVGVSGDQGQFSGYNPKSGNKVVNGIGPNGSIEPLWECSGVSSYQAGGFSVPVSLEPSKSYRYALWVSEDANNDHLLYVGCNSGVTNISGGTNSNPYFFYALNLPKPNKWYLMVSYLHANGYTGTGTGDAGIYDPATGEKFHNCAEFVIDPNHTSQSMRAFRYQTENPNTKAYFTRPRVEVVNGEELSIASMLGRIPKDGAGAFTLVTNAGEFKRTENTYTKIGETGWNAGLNSKERYTYAEASARVGTAHNAMIGLSTTPSNGQYQYMDYAIYAYTGRILCYEGGANLGDVGSCTSSDVLSVVWNGDKVRYLKNGVELRSAASKPTQPLLLDLAAHTSFAPIYDISFTAIGRQGQDGQAGTRGSIELQIGNTDGVWYDTLASNSVPNGVPVTHDRVTIYKVSDPAIQTVKRYNGSSWVSYVLHVHGSALIEDTLDGNVLRAGTRIESPRIDLIGNNFMKIELASGFGPDSLWYWMGPKLLKNGLPDLNNLTKANAKEWKDLNANSFTVGTFISGSISNSVSTSQLISTPFAEIEFTSNGNSINFAVSYNYHSFEYGPRTDSSELSVVCPASPTMATVSGTVYLERWNGSSWSTIKSETFSSTYSCVDGRYEIDFRNENEPYRSTVSALKSFTVINTPGSGYQKYRVRASVNNFSANSNVKHYLSLAASE